MTAAGAPAAPRAAVGPPRPGWPAMYLWLVSALVGWAPPTEAVTRISVTWQRIWLARGVVPKTLPITAILAGLAVKAAAHAQKVLVNGWQALRRPSTEVTRWLVPSTIAAFPWDSGDAANAGALTRSTRLPGHLSGRTANDRGTRTWPPVTGSRPTTWKIAHPTKESAKRRSTTPLDLETAAADTHIQPTTSFFRSK